MADVDKLLRQYVTRFESGGSADPSDVLARAEGADRAKLSALIEGYLEHFAPDQQWDPEAFEGSVAERATALVAESWSAEAGRLPHRLVALRNQKKLKRSELVRRLAESLGVGASEEKVRGYYHELERGLLPSEGVSSRVFDALAKLLDTSADALRRAGESVAPSAGGEPGAAYARLSRPAPADKEARFEYGLGPRDEEQQAPPDEADWDEVDRLFLGGA